MKCWICGDEANSGEHMIKASDLKSIFGRVTQNTPLYFHTDEKRNQRILGIKSSKLKFSALLCRHCNNKRTQPHDRAWEKLSLYLRTRKPPVRAGDLVRLSRPFPGAVRQSMLGVHLFFLKLFGCLVVQHSIPLALDRFSQAILLEEPHPNVWLAFSTGCHHQLMTHVGGSEVETAQLDGRIVYAVWSYTVGDLTVTVMYAEPTEHRKGLVHAWHPSSVGKRVRVIGH